MGFGRIPSTVSFSRFESVKRAYGRCVYSCCSCLSYRPVPASNALTSLNTTQNYRILKINPRNLCIKSHLNPISLPRKQELDGTVRDRYVDMEFNIYPSCGECILS